MNLSSLLDKKLILLSGKGGVGKTTIATSLGLLAAKKGKKTLIIEMNSTDRVGPFFGVDQVGHQEIEVSSNLNIINLSPQDCFEEYVLRQIPLKRLVDFFVKSKYVTYFLNAVPGFNELLMMGKIIDLILPNKKKQSPEYDLVIVDGPATGHGVSVFEIPKVVYEMVESGPLHHQSKKMVEVLKDSSLTAFSAVSIAEEMPVNETCDLLNNLGEKVDINLGPVFMNQISENPLNSTEEKKINDLKDDSSIKKIVKFELGRAKLNQQYLKEFKKLKPELKVIEIGELDSRPVNFLDLNPIIKQLEENLNA